MIDVAVSRSVNLGGRVYDDENIGLTDHVGYEKRNSRLHRLADRIAVVRRCAQVLVGEVDKVAIAEVGEKSFGIPPTCRDRAATAHIDINRVRNRAL